MGPSHLFFLQHFFIWSILHVVLACFSHWTICTYSRTHTHTHTPCFFMHCFLVLSLLFCSDDEKLGVGNSGSNNNSLSFVLDMLTQWSLFTFTSLSPRGLTQSLWVGRLPAEAEVSWGAKARGPYASLLGADIPSWRRTLEWASSPSTGQLVWAVEIKAAFRTELPWTALTPSHLRQLLMAPVMAPCVLSHPLFPEGKWVIHERRNVTGKTLSWKQNCKN